MQAPFRPPAPLPRGCGVIGSEGSTVYLLVGLVCLVMAAITWALLRTHRTTPVGSWCMGNILFALGIILAWHQGGRPDWFSLPGANLIALAGLLSGVQAMRKEAGAPWRLTSMLLIALGFIVSYQLVRRIQGHPGLAEAFVTLAWLLVVAQVAGWAWVIHAQRGSTGALTIAASQSLLAVALVFYFVILVLHATRSQLPSPVFNIVGLGSLGVFTAIVSDVGFIGIAMEKLVRQWTEAAASQARQEERQVLGQQLVEQDRQRGFGLVAASLAHELNQPLTAILASAQALQRGTAGNRMARAQVQALLEKVILNARRISGITGRFRTYIRPAALDPGPVDLGKVVRDMLDLLEPELRRHQVQVSFPPVGPVVVAGDAIQLSQVVLNVLRNAMEAVQAGGERAIRIRLARAGEEALLTIQDTGPGVAPGLAHLVGQPHVTTKAQGLGLGLSISTAILQQHQGSLAVATAPEGGACAQIRLPLAGTPGGAP